MLGISSRCLKKTSRPSGSSYFSPMVAESKFLGQYWSIPTAVRTLALFWNKDLFRAAGLDPEKPPTTLDELVEMAQALTIYDGSGTEVLNITQGRFRAAAFRPVAQHWFREVLLRQYGGAPYSEDGTTVTWNSPKGAKRSSICRTSRRCTRPAATTCSQTRPTRS
ncbi:MAG: extracellular solute-binding protein [Chloroflexi bacterium]|nr:extracellular solute-binding protein [Chloroflexota bacterium]